MVTDTPTVVSDDWATITEEEIWKSQHDQTKLDKKNAQVKDVLVASASDDGTLCIWRPLQGNEICTLSGHSDRVVAVGCSGKGTMATSSLDKSIRIWQPVTEEETRSKAQGHNAEVTCVVLSQNGKIAASASR